MQHTIPTLRHIQWAIVSKDILFDWLTRQFSGWSQELVVNYEACWWQDWRRSRVSLHMLPAQAPDELTPL